MYQRIRDLREDADLSQQQMAEMLCCTQQAYSNYERGRHDIPLEILSKIASIHHTSTDYLLDRTDERRPYPPRK